MTVSVYNFHAAFGSTLLILIPLLYDYLAPAQCGVGGGDLVMDTDHGGQLQQRHQLAASSHRAAT